MKYRFALVVLSLVALILTGCARYPANHPNVPQRTVSFDLTVAGRIDPSKFYFVAIDTDQNSLTGPLPSIAPPWGNGWATGAVTHYVEYSVSQPGLFGVYKIVPGTGLQASEFIGAPFEAAVMNGNTIHVTLDLDAILPPSTTGQYQTIQVNFITTDQITRDPNFPGPKQVDALGAGGTSYVSIPVVSNRIFRNNDVTLGAQEGAGDMQEPNPDLDISDWKIEVRVN